MAYDRINWQNEPSEATALNDVNLNKMDSAIYDHDQRLDDVETDIDNKVDKVAGKGLSTNDYTDADKAIVDGVTDALAGKVDKEEGKGLSSNDYTTAEKNKLAGISAGAKNVSISDTLADGDTIANVTIDGVTTSIKASQPKSEEMNVRSAMMLLTPPISNNAPYVKRVVGGGITNPYLCKLNKIIGASVVWNQLVKNPDFSSVTAHSCTTTVSSGELTATASSNTTPDIVVATDTIPQNHVFLFGIDIYPESGSTLSALAVLPNTLGVRKENIVGGAWTKIEVISKDTAGSRSNPQLYFNYGGANSGKVTKFKNYKIVDLTAMFGTTIADYVNTLETQTAGSGIAWLKSYGFFTEEYYAYSANTMQSVSVSGKKNVGYNRLEYDKWKGVGVYQGSAVFENNGVTLTQNSGQNAYTLYSPSDFGNAIISVKAGDIVRLSWEEEENKSGNNFIFGYSGTTNIGNASANNNTQKYVQYTVPSNVDRVTFSMGSQSGSGTIKYKNIMVQISSANTAFEPYTETTYPLDHTTLRGLFKLDANNNLYADGDVYPSDGNGDVKYAVVDLGTINWLRNSTYNVYYAPIPGKAEGKTNILTSKYVTVNKRFSDLLDKEMTGVSNTLTQNDNINIKDDDYNDATDFKNAMSGVYLLYELVTPTTAELTPFTELQNIESGGTEEFIDYGVEQGTRDVSIPCGQETEYNSGVAVPNLPTSGGKVELTYNPANGQFTWE